MLEILCSGISSCASSSSTLPEASRIPSTKENLVVMLQESSKITLDKEQAYPKKQAYLEYARKTRASLLEKIDEKIWDSVDLKDVAKVCIILSSSRGGSSLLFWMLTQTQQVLSSDGEHIPFYKLNDHSSLNDNFSDQLPFLADREHFSIDIISSLRAGPEIKVFDAKDYIKSVALRIAVQWPQLNIPFDDLLNLIEGAFDYFFTKHKSWNSEIFYIELCSLLSRMEFAVNPFYYDINTSAIKVSKIRFDESTCPPDPLYCIEEPPFIVIKPRRRPSIQELKTKPVVLKASVDAYRLPLIRTLFPHADISVIHLVRNPAASINGLYGGWLNRGFYSHNLYGHRELSIAGYSDKFEWGKSWWKFDLPPGWKKVVDHPLEFVCGFQWLEAHKSITAALEHSGLKYIRIPFEDIIYSTEKRMQTIYKINNFLGLNVDQELKSAVENIPIVMATTVPQKRRWLERDTLITPVIEEKNIAEFMLSLGYDVKRREGWL